MSFSASPVQIYASKIAVFGMARDGIKASAYCSMRNWNIPRIFRPSVRVGAHRAINSGGMAPLRLWAQRSKIACIFTVFQAITIGEQAQRIGNGLHFILALGLMAGDAAGVDQALQGVGRFAAIEDA